MEAILTSFLPFLPYVAGFVVFVLGALFFMFRADAIRAGKEQPTKLAVQLTLSTIYDR